MTMLGDEDARFVEECRRRLSVLEATGRYSLTRMSRLLTLLDRALARVELLEKIAKEAEATFNGIIDVNEASGGADVAEASACLRAGAERFYRLLAALAPQPEKGEASCPRCNVQLVTEHWNEEPRCVVVKCPLCRLDGRGASIAAAQLDFDRREKTAP